MTANETKFVAEIKALLAKGKVPAPKFFEVGKLCGLKCKEVVDAKKAYFSGETKTASAPSPKPTAKPTSEIDELKSKYGSLVEDEEDAGPAPDFGIVTNTPEAFVWIASPEEIENPTDLHATTY